MDKRKQLINMLNTETNPAVRVILQNHINRLDGKACNCDGTEQPEPVADTTAMKAKLKSKVPAASVEPKEDTCPLPSTDE